jgi:hypothetical protein
MLQLACVHPSRHSNPVFALAQYYSAQALPGAWQVLVSVDGEIAFTDKPGYGCAECKQTVGHLTPAQLTELTESLRRTFALPPDPAPEFVSADRDGMSLTFITDQRELSRSVYDPASAAKRNPRSPTIEQWCRIAGLAEKAPVEICGGFQRER